MIIEFSKDNDLSKYNSDILYIEELYKDLDNNNYQNYDDIIDDIKDIVSFIKPEEDNRL